MQDEIESITPMSDHPRDIACERIAAYQEKKSVLPEPWRISVHDESRVIPAKPLPVDEILRESLGDLIGLK